MATPYGAEHQKTRAQLLPKAYGKPCPRCGELMLKGQELELDHDLPDGAVLEDFPGLKADRIVHARCNEKAGLIAGQEHSRYRPSRKW